MKLKDLIKTVEIKIPDTDIVIVMRKEIFWLEHLDGLRIENADERGVYYISRLITSWNIDDDNGKTLEISVENIKKLPAYIIQILVDQANQFIREGRKKKRK